MTDDNNRNVIPLPTREQREQEKRIILDGPLAEIVDFRKPPRLGPLPEVLRRSWYKSRYVLGGLALALGAGIFYYTFLREGNLEEQIQAALQPLRQEFSYACSNDQLDSTLPANLQKTAWVTARKERILQIYGCDPTAIQWYCPSAASFSHVHEENTPLTCAKIEKRMEDLISDPQHGTGRWDYNAWKTVQQEKQR